MGLIEEDFTDYRNRVIHADAPQIQLQECRRAFYAGAWAVSCTLKDFPELAKEIEAELIAFKNAVLKEMDV